MKKIPQGIAPDLPRVNSPPTTIVLVAVNCRNAHSLRTESVRGKKRGGVPAFLAARRRARIPRLARALVVPQI